MLEVIVEKKDSLFIELENAEKALNSVKASIDVYRLKAQEIVAHINYTKGAINILEDVLEHREDTKHV